MRKNCVIPGYLGYVPSLAADSLLQKRLTEQSRDVLTPKNLDERPMTMASTGFNRIHIPQQDDTLNATSRRYGTETCPYTHPKNHAHYAPNETTFRASFIDPKRYPSQVYRNRDTENSVSTEMDLKIFDKI